MSCRILPWPAILFLTVLVNALCRADSTQPNSSPQLALQVGHSNSIVALTFSPRGDWLVSGSIDNTLKVWDVATGLLTRTLSGHTNGIGTVTFSPDGKLLVSGSRDHTIKIWDVESGQLMRTLDGHNAWIKAVAFSPDGKLLVSGSRDHTIKIWDVETGQLMRTHSRQLPRNSSGYSPWLRVIAFSPDARQVVSGSDDGSITLWSLARDQVRHFFNGHTHWIEALTFSPNGKLLVSGSADKTLRLWDVASGQVLLTLSGHTSSVRAVVFSPDGKHLITGSDDRTAKLWDVESGQLLRTLNGHTNQIHALAFSPDGKRLVSAGADTSLRLWDVESGQLLRTVTGQTHWVHFLAFSADGKHLVSSSQDNTINLWDRASGQLLRTFGSPMDRIQTVAISPDGELMAAGRANKTVKLWHAPSGQLLHTLSGHSLSLAFSSDGKHLASGGDDRTIQLWDVTTGQRLRTLRGHNNSVATVAFSPDGKQVASGDGDSLLKLWDVDSGQLLRTLRGHSHWIHSVAFSPDGKLLVSGSADETVRLWEVASGGLLHTLSHQSSLQSQGQLNWIVAVAFSADGTRLVSGSSNSTLTLWDVASGQPLATLSGHTSSVKAVAFSPDGKHVVSGGGDETIRLWDVASGGHTATLLLLPEVRDDIQARAKALGVPGGAEDSSVPAGGGEWFISTPEGYFDCSANAARYIRWNLNNRLYAAESYYRKFRRPDLVRRRLRGEAVPSLRFSTSDAPPKAHFLSVQYEGAKGRASARQRIYVTVTVEARGGHDFNRNAIHLLVNDRPVPPEHEQPLQVSIVSPQARVHALQADTKGPIILGDKPIILGDKPIVLGDKPATLAVSASRTERFARRFTFRVPLPLGDENVQLKIVAYDRQDLGSTPSTLWLRNKQAQPVQGNLYALCVGLSHYRNGLNVKPGQSPGPGKIANLEYPRDDAIAMARRLRQEARGFYRHVEVHTLLDQEVTPKSLQSELKWLQRAVRPGQVDTVVVFLSGHGLSTPQGQFLFPTHGFDSSSDQSMSATSLSGTELQRELGSALRARAVFLFVDSCYSGALAGTRDVGRGAATGDDLTFAIKESGVYLLASSGALQRSLESNTWGHGIFTQALLDSLRSTPHARQGLIHFDVLTYLVPEKVSRLLREAKINENAMSPVVPLEGRYLDKPVVRVQP